MSTIDVNAWLNSDEPTLQQPPSQVPPSSKLSWLPWMLVLFLGCFLLLQFLPSRSSDDRSNVNVDSVHLLILEESADRDKLTEGQLSVLTSVPLRKEIDGRKGAMRVIDRDDISQLGNPWSDLANLITEPLPAGIVSKGGYATQFRLKDAQSTIDKVKSADERR